MREISLRIWRNPAREEIRVDGELVPHDVVVHVQFEDLPTTTTIGEIFGVKNPADFRSIAKVDREELAHPECPSCMCHPMLITPERK